jgi:hypothetical protein
MNGNLKSMENMGTVAKDMFDSRDDKEGSAVAAPAAEPVDVFFAGVPPFLVGVFLGGMASSSSSSSSSSRSS